MTRESRRLRLGTCDPAYVDWLSQGRQVHVAVEEDRRCGLKRRIERTGGGRVAIRDRGVVTGFTGRIGVAQDEGLRFTHRLMQRHRVAKMRGDAERQQHAEEAGQPASERRHGGESSHRAIPLLVGQADP